MSSNNKMNMRNFEITDKLQFESDIKKLSDDEQLSILCILLDNNINICENNYGTNTVLNIKDHKKTLYMIYDYLNDCKKKHILFKEMKDNLKQQEDKFKYELQNKKEIENNKSIINTEKDMEGTKINLNVPINKFDGIKGKLIKSLKKKKK